MAKKQNITFEQNKENENEKHLKPYCEAAEIAAEYKRAADELRPLASEELKAKLDEDPETKDFTGTVVYLCDGKMYKIRVQRPDNTKWMDKRLNDPNFKPYKALKKELAEKEAKVKEYEAGFAAAHPRCVDKGFVMAFLK